MLEKVFKQGIVVALAIFLFSCTPRDPKPADVEISIKTYVKNEEAVLDDIKYPTDAGHPFSLLNLKYYLTHISLVKEDGTVIELKKAHLKDIHDESTGIISAMNVGPGHYTGMTFTFGIRKADNVIDFLQNTVANQNMIWPTPLGPGDYHYMKFEGQYKLNGSDTIKGFAYHLGPTFGADYSIDVHEDFDLTIDETKRHLTIKMDLDRWFHTPNVYDLEEWSAGIMNKTAAQIVAHENGQNVFSVVVD